LVVAEEPVQAAARWARFAALLPRRERQAVQLETKRGRITIATREALVKLLGDAPAAPAIAGYAMRARQPKELIARCKKAGLAVQRAGRRHAVRLPSAVGGVWLIG